MKKKIFVLYTSVSCPRCELLKEILQQIENLGYVFELRIKNLEDIDIITQLQSQIAGAPALFGLVENGDPTKIIIVYDVLDMIEGMGLESSKIAGGG